MAETTNKPSVPDIQTSQIIPAKKKGTLNTAIDIISAYRGVWAFIIVFILGVIFSPQNLKTGHSTFLNWSTQRDILFEFAEYGILAAGMTLPIIAAGIDLSVGSVLGFAATFFSLLIIGYGWSPLTAILATVALTSTMGALSGFVISRFKIQPFVATLGMMLIARGAAKWISGGIKVAPGAENWYSLKNGAPAIFDWMTSPTKILGLQPVTLFFLLSIFILWIVLKYTKFGRFLYAIGGNEEAARLSGIRVAKIKIMAYAISGFTAGLAGMCNASRMTLGDPEAGATYELDAIAAVVIGGTSLMGGKGGMFFTFLGSLIIAYISKILSLKGIPEAPRLVIRGVLIMIAVLIQQLRKE